MIMLLARRSARNRIAGRLIVRIIAFSSVLTLIITSAQLFAEYRLQRQDLDARLEEVAIFAPTIAESVWTFDDRQIGLALEALIKLPQMEQASVTAAGGQRWQAGEARSSGRAVRSFSLTHGAENVGTLELVASLDGILNRVLSQAVAILVSNLLKTFLVAAFMYGVFRRLVADRVEGLAAKVDHMLRDAHPANASQEGEFIPDAGHGDEIDTLRWAFDDLSRRLRLAIDDLKERNHALAGENRERKRAEAELQSLVEKLFQANSELERFAYVATHDLQEPIRGLVSFSQLLLRKHAEALDSEGRDYLHFIIEEAVRLSRLVHDLLDYSRAGGQALDMRPTDCDALVRAVLDELQPTIEDKAARVTVAPLPTVNADAGQLRQLFANLLDNALKYATPGRTPEVAVSAERELDGWMFEVADNGIGIPPEYHAYVFEVFRRLHTRDSFPGTGIGLALCKRIVENHNGHIWLISEPGQGTRIRFTLPA
jgi:signal transduction histidine kinase